MARQRSDTLREALTRHSRDLLRFLTRRVGADVAPDLAQEAMLRALHYSEREEVREISSLLHSIAANLARDHVRRAILESRFLVRGLEVDDLIVGGLSPGARLEAEQAIKRFAEALEALPPSVRDAPLRGSPPGGNRAPPGHLSKYGGKAPAGRFPSFAGSPRLSTGRDLLFSAPRASYVRTAPPSRRAD